MKKLLVILIAIVCVFSAFVGCTGGGSSSKTIKIDGEEVMAGTLRRYVANRQETYLEDDEADASEWQWFDIDMEMGMDLSQTVDQKSTITTMEYELDGKMGVYYPLTTVFGDKIKFLYDLQIKITAKNESYNSYGEKITETIKMEGKVVCVDNVAYADLEVTLKSGGEEVVQSEKVKGDFEDILDIDMDELSEILGSANTYEGRLYGMSVSEVLDSFASQVGVHYYLDEDNNTFYIDSNQTQQDATTVAQTTMQYEIEFKKNSAVVKQEKVYVLVDAYSSGYQSGVFVESDTITEVWMSVKKIRSANITVPEDADSYQRVY